MNKDLLKTLLFFMFTLGVLAGVGMAYLCVWITIKVAGA